MLINRCIIIVLDSAGVGALPDAEKYDDIGANTLGHILDTMGHGYDLPNLAKLGLYRILNQKPSAENFKIIGSYGKLASVSPAKDTTSGHWELSGIILSNPFPKYPKGFPEKLVREFEKEIHTKVIGNYPSSGTEIIKKLGEEHCKTGYPIIYTSADSVFQIACHEEVFGLKRLYEICKIARQMLKGEHAVGRVIARPFVGENGSYTRTVNRKDYSLTPFEPTILDYIEGNKGEVIGIGKIENIFNGKGITKAVHSTNNDEGMRFTLNEIKRTDCKFPSLILTNLVDFDMIWGHRRNVKDYAKGLKDFDDFLPTLINSLRDDDILFITADHGCDPTFTKHTDHTREYVPLLVYGKNIKPGIDLGTRSTLADIAQTIADIFKLKKMKNGKSFKDLLEV